jgi:hypothetical protein
VIDNEGNGVVWTTIAGAGESGNYTGGAGDAATASSDSAGAVQYDTEMRTTSIDLTGWLPSDEVYLTYLANYQNFAFRDFLDVDISTDGGATWTTLLSWNEDHGSFRGSSGEAVSIDLSSYSGMSGLKLRWHYYDPTTSDNDWYAQVDEIGLDCVPHPVINVDPANLTSFQETAETITQTLNIGNLGSADLVWDIQEANATAVRSIDGGTGEGAAGEQQLSAVPGFAPQTTAMSPMVVAPLGLLVNDGSFENGPPPSSAWTETSNNACEWIGDWSAVWGAAAYDGVYDYWGGGYCSGVPSTDSVEQAITVPAGGQLSFWYLAYRVDSDDAAVDVAYVEVDGNVVWSLDLTEANNTFPDWENVLIDMSAYSGQAVTLRLGTNSFGDQTGNIRFDFVEFVEVAGCDAPSDVPWLSAAPPAGTTAPGGNTAVDVTTDSTGLLPGTYGANLCVNSNDPVTPLVEVPVEMTVLNAPPVGAGSPGIQWPHYSDEISPITITATDNIAEVLSAVVSWSSDSTNFSPGLPDFLSLSGTSCVDSGGGMQTCTWTISGA